MRPRPQQSRPCLERVSSVGAGAWRPEFLFEGLSFVPDPCYLGGYRGTGHPWLIEYEVTVGMHDGVPPKRVPQEVGMMLLTLGARIADVTRTIAPGHVEVCGRDRARGGVGRMGAWRVGPDSPLR